MEKFIVFIGTEKKVSQQGAAYNVVTLGEVTEKKDILNISLKSFFVPESDDYSKISFGAIVEAAFGEPKTFGGYPPLVDVIVVTDSPYEVM